MSSGFISEEVNMVCKVWTFLIFNSNILNDIAQIRTLGGLQWNSQLGVTAIQQTYSKNMF